jgi:hypothetical protein
MVKKRSAALMVMICFISNFFIYYNLLLIDTL